MIYGSLLLPAAPPELAEAEKQAVVIMQAALSTYPWQTAGLCGLAGSLGCGAMGAHSGDKAPAAGLLPSFGDLSIAADARLDNRPELRAALVIPAAEPLDDAELILRAYRQWGESCASYLLGDFAFAIWDAPAGRLYCARDFIGARPFYYYYTADSGRFAFASDLLALTAHPQVPTALNLAYVVAVLQSSLGQFQHPEHTFFEAVEKLPPAHCLSLDASGLRLWAYWQPGQTPERRYPNERDYIEELLTLLRQAVACRIPDGGPVGAHISGGLDSSSVAVLAHRILQAQGRAVTGFSWAPPLPDNPADLLPNDERKLVEAVRQAEGFPVRYTRLTPQQVCALVRRDVTRQPTVTLQFELSSSADAAGLGIRTLLSGWGGDEFVAFNGRGYFPDLLRRGRWMTLWFELTRRAQLHGGSALKNLVSVAALPLLPVAIQRMLIPTSYPPPRARPAFLRPTFAATLAGISPLTNIDGHERPGVYQTQIALLQHGHLNYRMESWASQGASLGITYVYPLLDRRLVEFALSIPDHLSFKNGWKRYLYRTAMADILPDSLRWQKVKEDPALAEAGRKVHPEAIQQLRLDLLARADNPYIDIDQLLAAIDREQDIHRAFSENKLLPRERRHLAQQLNAERVMWLAFVDTGKSQGRPA